MSTETLEIGATPPEEDCTQVGSPDYHANARRECLAFIAQLVRQFGEPPEGARLFVKSNAHDFGSYLEVACRFDVNIEAACDYAYKCEGEAWPKWDREALLNGNLPAPASHLDNIPAASRVSR